MQRIKKRHPSLSLRYIKILRGFMWFTGGWPGEALQDDMQLIFRFHRILMPVTSLTVLFGIFNYGVNIRNELSFFIIGCSVLTSFISIMIFIRAIIPFFKEYSALTKYFLHEFHLINVKNKNEYANNTYLQIEKMSYYMAVFEGIVIVFTVVILNVSIFYVNLRNGAYSGKSYLNVTRDYAVSFDLPGYKHRDHFHITTILCAYFSYNVSSWICCVDLLIILMLFQIIGHLMILRNSMENMIKPKNSVKVNMHFFERFGNFVVTAEMFDDEENERVGKHLAEIINHHCKIINFSDRISSFYGPILVFNYFFSLVGGCLLLVEMRSPVPGAVYHYGSMGICIFGELILLSPIFEFSLSVSEKLIDAVYDMPWQCMDTRNRSIVYLLLARVQRPLQVTAMGIVPVGVTTMLKIIKTTFSYYAMLKTLE